MASPRDNSKSKVSTARRPVRPGKSAPRSEKVQVSFIKAVLSRTFLIVAAAVLTSTVLLTLLFLWFNKVYADPENVFWGMVNNNLSTHGVTKELKQGDASGSQTELTQVSLNPSPIVRNARLLSYKDESGAATNLTLEAILTPGSEYQHYASIDRGAAAGSRDYSQIYGMWLKNDTSAGGQSTGFDNAIYGAFLFANLDRHTRTQIINKLRQAYRPDFSSVEKKIIDGRRNYTYDLRVNMRPYASAAQAYAKALGLPASISPADYKPDDQILLKVTVDALTRQIKSVEYQGALMETYSGYGIPLQIELPTKTVSPEELQKAIQSVGC